MRKKQVSQEQELERTIRELEGELKDRENALPPHSIQPQHLLMIERLEEAIEEKRKMLKTLKGVS